MMNGICFECGFPLDTEDELLRGICKRCSYEKSTDKWRLLGLCSLPGGYESVNDDEDATLEGLYYQGLITQSFELHGIITEAGRLELEKHREDIRQKTALWNKQAARDE